MAQIGQIPLITDNGGRDSGASFTLTQAAPVSGFLDFGNAEVEVRAGQRDGVVRFLGATDARDCFSRGYELAQQGLDLLSIRGRGDLAIDDAENEHMLWWRTGDTSTLRLVSTATLRFQVGSVTLSVIGPDGNPVPPPPPERPQHHVGFRYYRLAQCTEDLYDGFRNMYLAFEVLLSSRYPKARDEQEIQWLERALRAAAESLSLRDLLPAEESDPVAGILRRVYRDARLRLFHAKEGRDFYPPHASLEDRVAVSEALRLVTRIVLRMAENWYQTRRLGGGVSLRMIYEGMPAQLRNTVMVASDDPSPFDPAGTFDPTPYALAPRFLTRLAPELQRGPAAAVLGSIDVAALAGMTRVRRIELIGDTHIVAAQELESDLTLEGIDRLEVVLHMHAMNAREPKSLYRQ